MIKENELKKAVKKTLFNNMIKGYSKKLDFEYCYTKPAIKRYPFQYFWDTCFHVHMLLLVDEFEHAKHHLASLFAPQKEDGFIGNIIYWKRYMPARITDYFQMKPASVLKLSRPHMSDIIQPPILAQAMLEIYDKTKDLEYIRKMLPKLKKYYHWLAENRDFDKDNLLSIITTFESGMDWKPTYDPVVNFYDGKANYKLFLKVVGVDFKNFIRNYNLKKIKNTNYFRVKDAGFNSMYARNLQDMARLCSLVGDAEGKYFDKLADEVVKSMVDLMYDEQDAAFYDVHSMSNEKLKILTPTIFYPVIINRISQEIGENVMNKHFYKSDEFDTPFPLPSVAQNSPAFNPTASKYLWRGPTWIVNNWYMHKYLIHTKHHKRAKTLMKSMLELIDKSGFREYYDPYSGKGYGAHDFTWGGLILDMLQKEKEENIF